MLVVVHVIWISVCYICKFIFKKSTADKAVQVVTEVDCHCSTSGLDELKLKVKPDHVKERTNNRPTYFSSKEQESCHSRTRNNNTTKNKSFSGYKSNKNNSAHPVNHSKPGRQSWPMAMSRSNPKTAKSLKEIQKNNSDVSLSWLLSLQEKQGGTSAHQMNDWHDRLESVWFDDSIKSKSQVINWTSETLKQYFSTASNPFALALYLTQRSRDYLTSKSNTLSYFILKQFDQWLKSPNNTVRGTADSMLTHGFRFSVLRVVTAPHTTLLDLAVKAFNLNHSGNEYCVPVVKELLANKKYNQAAQCISKLQLQSEFTMEEIVLPLILQDKVNVVEDYLAGNAEQQKLAVKLLDHMCDPQTNLHQLVDLSGVENVKMQKLQKKTLSKLACRLMKLFQIPYEVCPNISNARGLGALKYLMYKKYIEKSFGSGSWDEMIQSAVGSSAYLRQQLVEQIMCYNDLTEAAKWANYYNLEDSSLPVPVREARARLAQLKPDEPVPSLTFNEGDENWDDECIPQEEMDKHYHSLAVTLDQVTIIDTKQKLKTCVQHLTVPGTVIGIDSEWRPAFANTPARVALLQMAVRDHVFLIDCHVLSSVMDSEDWSHFTSSIFCNQSLLKLGFGFEGDLKMLVNTFPSMKEPLLEMKRVINIEDLTKQMFGDGPVMLNEKLLEGDEAVAGPSCVDRDDVDVDDDDDDEGAMVARPFKFQKKEERGLSELVRRCLGKPLCKIEQMSDWERRPLRTEQLVYAALDAYVLLEVYGVLLKHIDANHLDIDPEPLLSHKWCKPTRNDKKKAKAAGKKLPKPETTETSWCVPRSGPPMRPNQLRVVVDTMLQGLGRHLRSCGVDVRILENNEDHEKTVQICRQEGRLVLSSGKPFAMIRAHILPEMCYNVQSEKARDQAAEVLHHFNVTVTQEDIFSRCQICNGDNYIKIPSPDLKLLYQRLDQLKKGNNSTEQSIPDNVSRFLIDYGIDWSSVRLVSNGVLLQVDAMPKPMFDKVDLFFCCATCGKVFWEGTHFTRVCDQFKHVLDVNDKSKTVYNSHMQEK
ncbi:exonuclease mut-7 homolog isoform X2 [Gigantopelta aegis]|uniref:exonuclease mut-7 homolog isoform X2 n=1 Tax=Gigantopelta aegis TaxID=1735272 RepID=UPI001B88D71E|nr:exonuclease mut-7 homolog isoform X2 [Gigantopelta aegis]